MSVPAETVLAVETSPIVHPARDWASEEERAAWYWQVEPTNDVEQLTWLLLRWRTDPVCFAIECLRVIPLPYQVQILLDLADVPAEVYAFYGADPTRAKRQVVVSSGHGIGKTRTEAMAIEWHLYTHKFSKTLVTAPTMDQITGQLWGEISKLHRRIKARWPALAEEWNILTSSIRHKNEDFQDWFVSARTARAEAPEGLQGSHGEDADDEFGELARLFGEEFEGGASGGMLVIAEEASGVPQEVREVLEGTLSEPGARFLAMGNATRPDGWFAESLGNPRRYAVHSIDCRTSDATKIYRIPYRDFGGRVHQLSARGRVSPTYWENLLRECDGDEDHDRFRVRVRGLPPRSAFEQTILLQWLEEAEARPPDEESKRYPVVIALDFGLSSDKHALAVRQGFNIRAVHEWLPRQKPYEITHDAEERAHEAVRIYGIPGRRCYIVGDANGVGRGAMENLYRYYHVEHPELGVTVIFFNAGAKALDDKRYYLRRDELWHKYGRPFFANPRTHLCKVDGLKRQLTAPGFFEDERKKIWVESKEDIKKRTGMPSGNAADAVLHTLIVTEETAELEKPKEEPRHPKVFLEHWERLRQQEELERAGLIR